MISAVLVQCMRQTGKKCRCRAAAKMNCVFFLQKGLPIDRKYGIVEWYGIILVLYSDKGVLSGTLFYEQLAADVREAGENPAQFRYRVGECHADATGIL